ncbi:MAG: GTP-binding protein [Promethearchaeota archaeon]
MQDQYRRLNKINMYDAIFKVVIFGDAGCGKTTLRKRYMTNQFISSLQGTIGIDFDTKILEIDGKEVKLLIWDFGGEERFRFIFPKYIYGAMGGILMYDITNYSSFSHIGNWLSVIKETGERFPIILIGAKSDLEDFREISWREGKIASKLMDLKEFLESSSKTGENVKEAFTLLTRMMINRMGIKAAENQKSKSLIEIIENKTY